MATVNHRTRWYAITATAAAATAVLAAGTALALTRHGTTGPAGPAAIIGRDGYTLARTWTGPQVRAQAATAGTTASVIQSVIGTQGAAYGTRGTLAEAVLALSPSGRTLITATLPAVTASALPHGETARIDGDYLIVDGPASLLSAGGLLQG